MTRGMPTTIALAAAVLAAAATAGAEPFAWDGGHDIGALMSLAEEHYDLATTDAIFLLDGRYITYRADGTRETTVHRIVWISTELATDTFADLRVPYDAATSSLAVHALRTWRDGRWWPHESELSPTAIVETTPGGLIMAADYTTVREAALLHDGVEIPCVLETAYTVTESRDPGIGDDGLWILPMEYPSIRRELSITLPGTTTLRHRERNGAPTPQTTVEGELRQTYRWVSDLVDRLERPLITDRASYAPHVEWSTWESQGAHGETIAARLEEAAVLSNALRDTVAELIENEPLDLTRARVVAEYVNESTRSIHYDDSHWELKPRTASRIWETAYGHRLDRAVLAAALFREAGLAARFVYRTRGYAGPGSGDVLSLARYDGIAVWVSGDGLEAYYDPESGTLDLGTTELAGRALWFAGDASGLPEVAARGAAPNVYELRVTLEPGEEGGFAGTGFVDLRGGLAPYDRTVGLDGECAGYLERVAAAAASGASLGEHGVVQMRRDRLTAGFGFDVEAPEPDGQGRIELGVGDPPGGILDRLPDDVHLYDAERGSPLTLFGPMRQTITLRLKIGEREAVRLPEPRSIENPLGRFSLSVEEEDGWITMTREVAVGTSRTDAESSESSPTIVAPEEWPLLRELLLEEADRANRAILLR